MFEAKVCKFEFVALPTCFHKAVHTGNLQVQNAKVPAGASVRRTPCSLHINGVPEGFAILSLEKNTDTSMQSSPEGRIELSTEELRWGREEPWNLGRPPFVTIHFF